MKGDLRMFHKPTLGIVLALALAGCSSSRDRDGSVVILSPPPLLPPERRENVWHPDEVAPYAVGRYVDPRDRNMVHEAHTVYRRERSSRPNLTPPATAVFPSGEIAASSATNAVLFFHDALTAELNQQRAASQAIMEQSQQLLQNVQALGQQAHSLRESAEESSRMRTQWQAVTSRLDRLERRLRETDTSPATNAPLDTKKWFRR